jgi:hypothetical protein
MAVAVVGGRCTHTRPSGRACQHAPYVGIVEWRISKNDGFNCPCFALACRILAAKHQSGRPMCLRQAPTCKLPPIKADMTICPLTSACDPKRAATPHLHDSRNPTANSSMISRARARKTWTVATHSIMASGFTAAQTGRTHDRTRPMLQQRQKVQGAVHT